MWFDYVILALYALGMVGIAVYTRRRSNSVNDFLLAGKDVYFDTAYVLESMDKETFLKILEKHGADRILFASDSPWQSIAKTREYFSAFGVSEEDTQKILYKNAEKLLK